MFLALSNDMHIFRINSVILRNFHNTFAIQRKQNAHKYHALHLKAVHLQIKIYNLKNEIHVFDGHFSARLWIETAVFTLVTNTQFEKKNFKAKIQKSS